MIKKAIIILAIFSLFCIPGFSQDIEAKLIEVDKDLYMVSGLGGNIAFLVTDDGVFAVDSGNTPALARLAQDKLAEKTDKKVTQVIFTHYHGDHTNGVGGYPENIKLIGHKNIVENINSKNAQRYKENIEENFPVRIQNLEDKLKELKARNGAKAKEIEEKLKAEKAYQNEYKTIKIIAPTVTFDDKMTIKMGDQVIQLIYPGNAHTNDNCLVLFKSKNVIHMGDMLFHEKYPYIDWNAGSNTANWIKWLEEVASWDIIKVIPGHGDLTDKSGLLKKAEFLKSLRAEVTAAIKKGMTLDKMKETLTFPQYKHFGFDRMRPICIEAVYNELSKK